MTAIPPPTPADLARDAAADLALCDELHDNPPWQTADDGTGRVYDRYWDGIYKPTHNNPNMHEPLGRWGVIARTALPAWIRRAAAAEAERDELQRQIDIMHRKALEEP